MGGSVRHRLWWWLFVAVVLLVVVPSGLHLHTYTARRHQSDIQTALASATATTSASTARRPSKTRTRRREEAVENHNSSDVPQQQQQETGRGVPSLTAVTAALAEEEARAQAPKEAPKAVAEGQEMNVLFLVAEDLRPQLGSYGSLTRTPNLDALASRGVRFENVFSQDPVCSPSRTSMMSGRRPDTTRLYLFESRMPREFTDLAGYFLENGYSTMASGKLYHWGGDHAFSKSWSGEIASWPGKNDAWNDLCDENYDYMGEYVFHANSEWQDTRFVDGRSTDMAIEMLKKGQSIREETGRPFFVGLGFHQPHEPWHFPERFWSMYEGVDFPVHDGQAAAPSGMPSPGVGDFSPQRVGKNPARPFPRIGASRYIRSRTDPEFEGVDYFKARFDREKPIPEAIRQDGIRGYSAAISFMDFQVGRILQALQDLGLYETTIVSFTSDHGLHVGEHGGWGKRWLLDASTRVPLILSDPRRDDWRHLVVSGMTELVDVFPTVAEMAGIASSLTALEPPPDGVSLVPLMDAAAQGRPAAKEGGDFAITQIPRCPKVWPKSAAAAEEGGGKVLWGPMEDAAEWSNCRGQAGFWSPGEKEGSTFKYHRKGVERGSGGPPGMYSWEGNYPFALMGYSIRTRAWRYTAWVIWDSATLAGRWEEEPYAEELYDHRWYSNTTDAVASAGGDFAAVERENVVERHPNVRDELFALLRSRVAGSEGGADHLIDRELWPEPPTPE